MVIPGKDEVGKAPMVPSQRLMIAFMAFLGNFFFFSTRVNLSVAILCMVRDNGTTPENSSTSTCGGRDGSDVFSEDENAEFDWDKTTTGEVLAMYYYGYIFTQILGGWLASRYGAKWVWGGFQAISAICTLLVPLGARTHVYYVYTLRFILGFAAGVSIPCVYALLGRWTPPLERSRMASFTAAGSTIGNVITLPVAGLLCEYGFDNGWASIFYSAGAGNLLWVFAWFWLVADSPDKHPHISEKERIYISNAIGKGKIDKVQKIPWESIATSAPVWAIVIAHFCNNYLANTMLTLLPMFMKESLDFNIKENGAVSALPYLSMFIGSVFVGPMADFLRKREIMSTKNVRRLCQCTALAGSSVCLIVVGFLSCDQRWLAVGLLCLCLFINSANRGGYVSNYLDLAPSFAGVLFGITNTFGTIPGIISPIIASALTPNGNAEEWRNVFYTCVGVSLFGAIVYPIFADGELQPWAIPPELNKDVEVQTEKIRNDKNNTPNSDEANGVENMCVDIIEDNERQ